MAGFRRELTQARRHYGFTPRFGGCAASQTFAATGPVHVFFQDAGDCAAPFVLSHKLSQRRFIVTVRAGDELLHPLHLLDALSKTDKALDRSHSILEMVKQSFDRFAARGGCVMEVQAETRIAQTVFKVPPVRGLPCAIAITAPLSNQ